MSEKHPRPWRAEEACCRDWRVIDARHETVVRDLEQEEAELIAEAVNAYGRAVMWSAPPPVLCPECQAAGLKSTVTSDGGGVTLMAYQPFWDEQGRRHNHDPNATQTRYRCSNGHHWQTRVFKTCWCGWTADPKVRTAPSTAGTECTESPAAPSA
jgi:hypothetical protein